jgi:hypothetical protein
MKYLFKVASRTKEDCFIEKKHKKVINGLKEIAPPWGIAKETLCLLPDFKDDILIVIPLKRILGNGIKGDLIYRYRRLIEDDSSDDDHLYIEFNPLKVDYNVLVNEVFKKYIEYFDAYSASIFNEELIFIDFEKTRDKNFRNDIVRFYPVSFLDSELCARALNLTPMEIYQKLDNHIEKVELFMNGVIIVGSSKVLTAQESEELDLKIRKLLI